VLVLTGQQCLDAFVSPYDAFVSKNTIQFVIARMPVFRLLTSVHARSIVGSHMNACFSQGLSHVRMHVSSVCTQMRTPSILAVRIPWMLSSGYIFALMGISLPFVRVLASNILAAGMGVALDYWHRRAFVRECSRSCALSGALSVNKKRNG
jgi:hypothetical protein